MSRGEWDFAPAHATMYGLLIQHGRIDVIAGVPSTEASLNDRVSPRVLPKSKPFTTGPLASYLKRYKATHRFDAAVSMSEGENLGCASPRT